MNYFLEKDLDSAEASEEVPEKGNEVIVEDVLSVAFLPYLLRRGLVNRIARIWVHPKIVRS